MSNPVASVEIQAKSTGLAAQLREARAKFGAFADGVDREMGKAFRRKKGFDINKRAGSFFGGAAQHALGNLASRGIQSVTDVAVQGAKDVFSYNDRIVRLKIAAQQTPEAMAALSKSVRQVSDATGVSKDKVLSGAEAYVRLTGDMGTARKETAVFAKVAQATNSEVSDIAETAAAMSQNMKVPAEQFEEMFSAMSIQGKAGAIELKDMASELSTIAPQWAQFAGGKGLRGARELGAAMQVVKKGFGGDAGETTVGIQNFLTAVQKKGDRFKDLGVGSFFTKTKDGKRDLKGIFEIVDQISKKNLGKDQLVKAFGSVEAYRAYLQLRDNREELDKLSDATQYAGTIQRDFNTYMDSSSGKLAKAWENMKNAIASTFTPERIQKFALAMEDLADKVKPVADFLGKAADAMGAVYDVGKKVRGFFDNDSLAEQFGGDALQYQRHYLNATSDSGYVRDSQGRTFERGSVQGQNEVAISKRELANREGYEGAKGNILGMEKNERSSKESVNAAIAALYSGNLGANTAGKVYLRNAGYGGNGGNVDQEKIQAIVDENMKALGSAFIAQFTGVGQSSSAGQLVDLLKQIAANTGAGTEVKVGADPVAKAAKNAPSNRNKVAR